MERVTGMKVVGICGSPRKGNTEWMLTKLLREVAKAGIDTELILLTQKDIKGCDGCLSCEAGGKGRKGICRVKDDMQQIYPKLVEADGLAFGTPVYFEMLSGLLKNFMDRTCPIWTRLELKPIVGIAVAEESTGKAIENLRTYSSVCGMRWVGQVTALAKTPEQVSQDRDVKRRLEQLGKRLISVLKA
jgi:multimeric flavodoxin WrbA